MFLENLTDGERSAFLGLARTLVHADGTLNGREEQVLGSLTAIAGEPVAEGTVEDLASAFQTRRAKVSALLELVGIGLIDGEYQPAERAMVAEVAKALGFSESELTEMEKWVVRQVALWDEAAQFWTDADL